MNPEANKIKWILRIAVAGEFIGHGVFAIQQKASWVNYFTIFGISPETALTIMPIIGIMDIALGLLILVKPIRAAILWMAFWGFATALIRPLSGEPMWDFIERWANWGAPLALVLLMDKTENFKDWWR